MKGQLRLCGECAASLVCLSIVPPWDVWGCPREKAHKTDHKPGRPGPFDYDYWRRFHP